MRLNDRFRRGSDFATLFSFGGRAVFNRLEHFGTVFHNTSTALMSLPHDLYNSMIESTCMLPTSLLVKTITNRIEQRVEIKRNVV